jgi:transcriptional regulator with XRE-family HTH domain
MSYVYPMAPGGPVQVRIRATRLAEWRRARGLTQRELARRLAVSQNYIPALEGGSRDPGPEMRGRLMASLGVGFFELFDIVLVGVAGEELHLQPSASPPTAPSPPSWR